ncbi:MAG TPA: hypothetical protein VKZ18_17310 [Polyangia bacterium]|nr:hypothetical protein [Polyangia bacterium]
MRLPGTFAAAGLLLAIGCGGGGGASVGPAGVDSSTLVSAASDTDKGALCDWYAGMVGGYGATATCAMAQITAPPDQATCVSQFPACDVTVALFEDCVEKLISAQNSCTQAALDSAESAASCQTVGMARCFY